MSGPRHKVVVAAIIARDGNILICQRPEGGWGAGMWEFPGGKLEVGEDPRAALARECLEELGVEVEVGAVFDTISYTYEDLGPVLLIFYWTKILSGELRAIEVGAFEWETIGGLANYNWLPADVPVIEKLQLLAAPIS